MILHKNQGLFSTLQQRSFRVIMYLRQAPTERRTKILIWLNKYKVVSMITENVFLAEHIGLHEKRIIKRLYKNGPFYNELSKEAQIIQSLNFKGIPRLEDVEEDEEYTYLIEEYIPGATLRELAESKSLTTGEILNILDQICIIIRYLHKQSPPVYYLDLNPNNVLINAEKEVFIVDFGAAQRKSENGEIAPQFGMRGFAAPEMQKEGKAGAYSDIYSIGCILYYMLTGKVYNGEKIARFGIKGRVRLQSFLRSTLSEDEKRRPDIDKLVSFFSKEKGKKIKEEPVVCNVKTIGFFGSSHGVGTTHIAVLLAVFIARKTGKKTAYVEFNSSGDCLRFKKLKNMIPNNLELIPSVTQSKYTELLNDGYEVFVVDFGSDLSESFSELLRCDVKCVISILNDIKEEKYRICLETIRDFLRQESWHFIFNLTEKENGSDTYLPKEISTHYLTYEKVTEASEKTIRMFSKLINRR